MKAAIFLFLLAACAAADQVRVTVRVVEVPHRQVTGWLAGENPSGPELHDRAVKLALEGGAEIVETIVLVARSGEMALAETVLERIYPTEYLPPQLPHSPRPPTPSQSPFRPKPPTVFETRNTGVTLEIAPTVSHTDGPIELYLSFETVDRASLETWMEFRDEFGDSSIRMPIFDTRRVSNALTLASGKFELLGLLTPKPAAVPAAATRQMVFVAVEILPVPEP